MVTLQQSNVEIKEYVQKFQDTINEKDSTIEDLTEVRDILRKEVDEAMQGKSVLQDTVSHLKKVLADTLELTSDLVNKVKIIKDNKNKAKAELQKACKDRDQARYEVWEFNQQPKREQRAETRLMEERKNHKNES